MKPIIYSLLFIFAISSTGIAQCSSKAEKLITKGKAEQFTDPDEAIQYLNKAVDICPDSEKALFMLADIYNKKKAYTEVINVLEKYLSQNKNPRANYFIAEAYQNNYDFNSAIENYQLYLDSDHSSRTLNLRALTNIEHAKFALESYDQAPEIEFNALPKYINSNHSEYLPIMTADESRMVFTRRIGGNEDAYYSAKNDVGEWTEPTLVSGLPAQFRKAALSMSIDGNMLVFAMADDPQGMGNFDLYYMENTNGTWTRPVNFGPLVNTRGWESQPCISADGRTVFFSSDRKGGEGGNDIWKTKRQSNGKWSKPTNLGLDINGPKNEESPFIHRDQRTLYFRSNSHPGLGSSDIFMSWIIQFKKWVTPVNLGYPINTIGNDGSLFVTLGGDSAYIASDVIHNPPKDHTKQEISNNIDIYQFPLAEKYRPIKTTYVRMAFIDAMSREPIIPELLLLDTNTSDTLYYGIPNDQNRVMLCLPMNSSYALTVNNEKYQPYFERFEPETEYWPNEPQQKIVSLHKVPDVNTTIESEPVVLNNVLFESNSAILATNSTAELDQLARFLNQNVAVKIDIRGHTDNVGDDDSNLKLSRDRAQSVYAYLIEKGVNESRLSYQGFGEQAPIASNDDRAGRAQNRRTEFVIIR